MPVVDNHGVSLHYEWDGPPGAPVVVLSNSLGTTPAMWDDLVSRLVPRFRVLRYDHRGHGRSSVPPGPYAIDDLGADVVALLDHLAVGPVSFCGLSLGGMVGMWLASRHPDRVERLVLCCTAPVFEPPTAWHERADLVREQGPGAVADIVLARCFTPSFLGEGGPVPERVRTMLASTPAEGYAACCEAIAGMDLRDALGRITAPTLVVAAADDPATPPAVALRIQAAIPHASCVVLADAAHLANLEQPDRFAAVVLGHLDAGEGVAGRGMAVRRQVLGDAHVDAAVARTSALTRDFQDFVTRYAWGEIWTRPGLDRPTRSCITLTALVALGRHEELALHVRGARANGLTEAQIAEVLLQTAVYCGVPAANAAFAVAQRVLGQEPGAGHAG